MLHRRETNSLPSLPLLDGLSALNIILNNHGLKLDKITQGRAILHDRLRASGKRLGWSRKIKYSMMKNRFSLKDKIFNEKNNE
jgi:hypothetical protein